MKAQVQQSGSTERLAKLAVDLHQADSPEEVTGRGAPAVRDFLFEGGQVSIQLIHGRRLRPQDATDSRLATADIQQGSTRQGPAIDVADGAVLVFCSDLVTTDRWPNWAAGAFALGWRSWISVELMSRKQQLLGVLTYAHPRPDVIGPDQIRDVGHAATHLAVAVDSANIRKHLVRAADSQAEIGRAIGVLMERYGIDETRAFSVLRRYSQDSNTKLRDIASQLLQSRQLPRPTIDSHSERNRS
jgi:hypothetical protein